MKRKPYIQPNCEISSVAFLLNDNTYGGDEGFVGLSNGGAKDASLGQANENGTFEGDGNSNNSAIWEDWN